MILPEWNKDISDYYVFYEHLSNIFNTFKHRDEFDVAMGAIQQINVWTRIAYIFKCIFLNEYWPSDMTPYGITRP